MPPKGAQTRSASNRSPSPLAPSSPGSAAAAQAQAQQNALLMVEGAVEEFLSGTAAASTPSRAELTASAVRPDRSGLLELANHGAWREATKLCTHRLEDRSAPLLPLDALRWKHARFVCWCKQYMFDKVAEELDQMNFLSEEMFFEHYPQMYPNKTGCMAPFALRALQARLPALRADTKTEKEKDQRELLLRDASRRLYRLLEFVEGNISRVQADERVNPVAQPPVLAPSTETEATHDPLSAGPGLGMRVEEVQDEPDSLEHWLYRRLHVRSFLVAAHTQNGQLQSGIEIQNQTLELFTPEIRRESSRKQIEFASHLQALGTMYLQAGQLAQAEATFERITAIDEQTLTQSGQRALRINAKTNEGLMHLSQGRMEEAGLSFAEVLKEEPFHITAANNRAVCLLYCCQLNEAVSFLESLIKRNPPAALHEAIVFNLCSLYDLQGESAMNKKKVLQVLVSRFVGDHFPQKALRI